MHHQRIQARIRRRPALMRTGEERAEGDDLEEDAARAPKVHLGVVHAVGEEALRGAVPARADVLRVGRLRVDAPAAAEVRKLQQLAGQQDVLRLDVPMENACRVRELRSRERRVRHAGGRVAIGLRTVAMYVIDGCKQLEHVMAHQFLVKRLATPADELIGVHLHELEHQRQTPYKPGGAMKQASVTNRCTSAASDVNGGYLWAGRTALRSVARCGRVVLDGAGRGSPAGCPPRAASIVLSWAGPTDDADLECTSPFE
eukprot:scaffold704_cov347-Prasinococcus_capsulatus_cf.AAC.21